jgi:hypothetical protein
VQDIRSGFAIDWNPDGPRRQIGAVELALFGETQGPYQIVRRVHLRKSVKSVDILSPFSDARSSGGQPKK